jgi:DNA-binding NarL/FixJ family response regulator
MGDKIRILLADDHGTVRTHLHTRLSREPDLDVVCEAGNSMDAIEGALTSRPHVVLIDPIMRDGFGLQAIQRLRSQLPDTKIIVLTAFTDTAMHMALRKMGVAHIMTKNLDVQGLVDLLKTVNNGSVVKGTD